ncbi:unnamed protein product [Closterium sp. NIES-53]
MRHAPCEWHDTLRSTLAKLHFFPSSANPSLFVHRGSTPFFVLVYVEDLVFPSPDRRSLASVKEELQRRHTWTDLGELQSYLGLQITRDMAACTITLMESHMVEVAKYVERTSGMGLVLGAASYTYRFLGLIVGRRRRVAAVYTGLLLQP